LAADGSGIFAHRNEVSARYQQIADQTVRVAAPKGDFAALVRRRARLRFRSALTNEFDVLAGPKPQPSAGQPLP
jgi:hypothetical protein